MLDGLAAQGDSDFELIIADDGSSDETKTCIDAFITKNIVPTQHIWHEDDGFRKSAILNAAIYASSTEYIVFLDGDCIPRPTFIADHRGLAKVHRIVGCSRILLDHTITQHIIDNTLNPHRWSFFKLLKLRISGHVNRIFPLIPLALGPIRALTPKAWKKVRGCNFGIFKEDLISIGGFDESFTGWGYEDSELVARAINVGCIVKRGDHKAAVLHLWHHDVSRDEAKSNKANLLNTIKSGRKTAISSSISTP